MSNFNPVLGSQVESKDARFKDGHIINIEPYPCNPNERMYFILHGDGSNVKLHQRELSAFYRVTSTVVSIADLSVIVAEANNHALQRAQPEY